MILSEIVRKMGYSLSSRPFLYFSCSLFLPVFNGIGCVHHRGNHRILCVDCDQISLEWISASLEAAGFEIIRATRGEYGIKLALQRKPDLILINLKLPDMDGAEVCRCLRNHPDTEWTPVIMLSDTSTESDMIKCFAVGGDDYIRRPFSIRELTARINTKLKWSSLHRREDPLIRVGPITIDIESYEAACNGEALPLTRMEFELLKTMASKPGTVLSREFLCNRVWGHTFDGRTRTVDVHIRSLRTKLKDNAGIIRTVSGEGYLLKNLKTTSTPAMSS